jgi:hypothetical protein
MFDPPFQAPRGAHVKGALENVTAWRPNGTPCGVFESYVVKGITAASAVQLHQPAASNEFLAFLVWVSTPCRRFYFSFAYAKHAFSYWWGPGNTEFLGPEMRLETGFDVMEMVANSSSDRRQVGRQKDPQRSSVTHGSKPSQFRLRVTRRDQQDSY